MSTATIQAAVQAGCIQGWAVEIGFDTILRYTSLGEPVYIDGDRFEPYPVAAEVTLLPVGANAVVTINDDGTVDAIEDDEDASGRSLKVWRVYRTSIGLEAELAWDGRCESYDSTEDGSEARFVGSAESLFRCGLAAPVMTNRCIWARDFKGPGCAHVGAETSCDGSLTTCTSYGNQARFVSAMYSPSPGEVIYLEGAPVQIPAGPSYPPPPSGGEGGGFNPFNLPMAPFSPPSTSDSGGGGLQLPGGVSSS